MTGRLDTQFVTFRRRPLRDRAEVLILTGIALAHCVVIALLVIALRQAGVLIATDHGKAIFTADLPAPLEGTQTSALSPPSSEIAVPVDVALPSFDTIDEAVGASGGREDPFAGAAVPIEQPQLRNVATVPRSAAFEQLARRLQAMLGQGAKSGTATAIVVVEVFAQPSGGFSDARIKNSSGDHNLDTDLLDALRSQEAIILPGLVHEPSWVELPPFSIGGTKRNSVANSGNTP